MLRLEDPIYLWLLLVIPVLVLIRFVGWRRRKMKFRRLGDPQLIKELMPDISCYRPTLKFVLQLVAIALLIVVLARPQMGTKDHARQAERHRGHHSPGYLQLYVGARCASVQIGQEQVVDRKPCG